MKKLGMILHALFAACVFVGTPPCVLADTNTIRSTSSQLMTYHIKHPRGAFYSYTGGDPSARLPPKREPIVNQLSVPHGSINVAANKTVSASDKYPIMGELSFLTDTNKSGEDKTILEIMPGKQWIQIDLGETCEVYAIAMWRHIRTWGPKVYHDVVILLSDDAQCTKNPRTIFNNDHDNSIGMGKGTDSEYQEDYGGKVITCFKGDKHGRRCRYVRIWSNGEDNKFFEVEVIGRPTSKTIDSHLETQTK